MDEYLGLEYEEFDRLMDKSKIELSMIDWNFLFNIHYEGNMHKHRH